MKRVDAREFAAHAAEYRQHEVVARACVPRDPNDWPTVAVAISLDAGIWTHDYDFFGCGCRSGSPRR